MNNRYFLFFLYVVLFGTILFWLMGYIVHDKRSIETGSWAVIILPPLMCGAYLLSVPLMFLFTHFDNWYKDVTNKISLKLLFIKMVSASIYFSGVFLFTFFKDYYETNVNGLDRAEINYFILYGICFLIAIAAGLILKKIRERYNYK